MLRTLMQQEVTTNQAHRTAALEHQQPRCAMLKLRRPLCFSQLCAALRASSAAPGGPMACSASREAEAGRVSASRTGGHAPRTGERVARKSASRACFCVTVSGCIAKKILFRG